MECRCFTKLSKYGISSDLGQSSVKLMRAAAAWACTRWLPWSSMVCSRAAITCERKSRKHTFWNATPLLRVWAFEDLLLTFSWNFFWKPGAKSVAICPTALQAAYLTLGCWNILLGISKGFLFSIWNYSNNYESNSYWYLQDPEEKAKQNLLSHLEFLPFAGGILPQWQIKPLILHVGISSQLQRKNCK